MLSVSDDGSGIDPDLMPLIFEPFVSTKDPEERSGLGLATVYGIVSQSGGTVAVESAPGHGTVFHVRLPRYEGFLHDDPGTPSTPGPLGSAARAEPTAGRSADPDSGPAAASRSEHAATILLVEDEPSVLALTRRILERHRYRVLAAASGEDALAQAEAFEGEIHLLLTDVMMPGMNGKQLAEKLAVARTGLPVLFISGYSAHIIAPEGVLETGFHFLAKPFSPESLTEKVAAILAGRTLHESRAPLPRTRGGEEP